MESTETIKNSKGIELFCYTWTPKEQIKALLYVGHGYAEHTGRYLEFATKMAELGFLVFAHDNIGHGKSGGKRVELNYTIMVEDVLQHVKIMKEKHPEIPVYIFGHSFGGAMAVVLAGQNPTLFSGMVLSGTVVMLPNQVIKPFEITVVRNIPNFLLPLRFKKLNANGISNNKDAVLAYKNDPLVDHGGARIGAVKETIVLMDKVKECMDKVVIPILVTHGKVDLLSSSEGSELLFSGVSSQDKTLKIYDGGGHEMLNETPERKEQYIRDVTEWFANKLNK